MELLEKVKEILKDSNKKGVAFTGNNSAGKTFFLEKCVKDINDEYKVIYIPENCQGLDTIEYFEETKGVKFGARPPKSLRDLTLVYQDRVETHQAEDKEALRISELLSQNYPDELKNFFKEKLKFELDLTKDPMEIKVNKIQNESKGTKFYNHADSQDEVKGTYSKLTSSGYKAMIRIASEIYLYLNENRDDDESVVIFIDEIDAKFYWTNREKYFKKLEEFIRTTFSQKTVKFIISSHMSETITGLPEGYSIMKILGTKEDDIEYKEYMSNNFLNQEQVERIIFDKKSEIFKESENLKKLKKLYFILIDEELRTQTSSLVFMNKVITYQNRNNSMIITATEHPIKLPSYYIYKNIELELGIINYTELSIKEKIFFNSIKKLMRW